MDYAICAEKQRELGGASYRYSSKEVAPLNERTERTGRTKEREFENGIAVTIRLHRKKFYGWVRSQARRLRGISLGRSVTRLRLTEQLACLDGRYDLDERIPKNGNIHSRKLLRMLSCALSPKPNGCDSLRGRRLPLGKLEIAGLINI